MDAFVNLGDIPKRVDALKQKFAWRDRRAMEVQATRRGDFDSLAPDLFSSDWPRPIVANMIDTSARDIAAVLAPLPSFNCSAATLLTDKAKAFADKRTKIVNNYVKASRLAYQMLTGADQYNTYGMLTLTVYPNFDERIPEIVAEESFNTYPVWNRHGDTATVARRFFQDRETLEAEYPDVKHRIRDMGGIADDRIEVIKWDDGSRIVCFCPNLKNLVLHQMANPLGRCLTVCTKKPSLDSEIRGTYDDVIWVQLARHRMQMLGMEAADKAVRAPLVVPLDVADVPYGPDAIIHTQMGAQGVGRARLDVPPAAFAGIAELKDELQIGAMSPESRSGQMDASVITGRGVQQLQAGFSAQIASAQEAFIDAFARTLGLCFELDEKLWPNLKKSVRGQDNGVPFSITYTPAKDIAGDHTVDVQYGMYAGLDPNRALVLTLQSQAAGLVSRDFARRQLPGAINAAEEAKRIQVESLQDSLLQGMAALPQSLPQMVAAGGDPGPVIQMVAAVAKALQTNKPLEDAIAEIFAPPEPAPEAPDAPPGAPGDPAAEGTAGFQSSGLPDGLQPGLATEGPQGRPDLQQFFAGLTAGGNPNLGSQVSRMSPAR